MDWLVRGHVENIEQLQHANCPDELAETGHQHACVGGPLLSRTSGAPWDVAARYGCAALTNDQRKALHAGLLDLLRELGGEALQVSLGRGAIERC